METRLLQTSRVSGLSISVASLQMVPDPIMASSLQRGDHASSEFAIRTLSRPMVSTVRGKLLPFRLDVVTVPFAEPVVTEGRTTETNREVATADAPVMPKRRPLQISFPKLAPPPGVPIKERLHALLQPPIDTLLGDNRLWLPFKPFPYQYEGINFLANRWSALLADEMGLGKTMQTIMAMRILLRSGAIRTVLLVCPKPLVTNWLREFKTWADEIPVATVTGDSARRHHFWFHDRSPVKLANYESLSRDADLFASGEVAFDLVVLDEAQRIKNRESKTAAVIHGIRRNRSWALTGTPVENQAADLSSLLDFTHNRPNVVEPRPDLLRDALSGILLRRTKDVVQKDMPARQINDVYIDLGPAQREAYDQAEKDGIITLDDMGEAVTIEHVFELIRRLKQICNGDPRTGESTKTEQLRSYMEEIAASGQKAILFTQWVTTCDDLGEKLRDFQPLTYHGKVPHAQRDMILREFKERKDRPLLLMSYGTGAVGLNLQFSNYVFLYDRWWNPAIEDQAINRAHRIGQKNTVFVYRFITPRTIEERIAAVLQKKRELFSYLIDDHDPVATTRLTREDIFGLFHLKVGHGS